MKFRRLYQFFLFLTQCFVVPTAMHASDCPKLGAQELLIESATLSESKYRGSVYLSVDGSEKLEILIRSPKSLKNLIEDNTDAQTVGPLSQITIHRGILTYRLSYREVSQVSRDGFLLLPGDCCVISTKIARH